MTDKPHASDPQAGEYRLPTQEELAEIRRLHPEPTPSELVIIKEDELRGFTQKLRDEVRTLFQTGRVQPLDDLTLEGSASILERDLNWLIWFIKKLLRRKKPRDCCT